MSTSRRKAVAQSFVRSNAEWAYGLFICGMKSAGKTSVCKALYDIFGCRMISFGEYVRYEFQKKQMSPEVKARTLDDDDGFALAAEGASLAGDPETLWQNALEHQLQARRDPPRAVMGVTSPGLVVVDGIRHMSILAIARRSFMESLTVFLDATAAERFERYAIKLKVNRRKEAKKETFEKLCKMPVESELPRVKAAADLRVDTQRLPPPDLSQLALGPKPGVVAMILAACSHRRWRCVDRLTSLQEQLTERSNAGHKSVDLSLDALTEVDRAFLLGSGRRVDLFDVKLEEIVSNTLIQDVYRQPFPQQQYRWRIRLK